MKFLMGILFALFAMPIAYADDASNSAAELVNATRLACSGISDEISQVSKISKVNTAVTATGTVASGGALAAGIAKSREDKEIEQLIKQICDAGGCTPEGVKAMSLENFFNNVMGPMAQIAELQKKLERSKKLGNWRTGLMAGTIGTNLASAIISGINADQSDLIQHIEACNTMIEYVKNFSGKFTDNDINPMEKKLYDIKTWCSPINTRDVEKIEKRMKGVMGTSIAGVVIGGVGTATSAAANSDKYMNVNNKLALSDADKQKEKRLNKTANIMAGANVATGLVETGLNVSLIKLTKNLIAKAEQCENILQ